MRCMDTRVVVVGNGVSGFACAARLADHGVPVTMIGPGLPHDRPPLSKRALTTGRVPILADAAKLAERGIEHLDGIVDGLRPRSPAARRSSSRTAARRSRSTRRRSCGRQGCATRSPRFPASSEPRRTRRRRASMSLVRAARGARAARGRRGRRADRHRDRGNARERARRDAARHARPPARALPAARLGGGARHARGARRPVPRLLRDRGRRAGPTTAAVVHTSTPRRHRVRRRRVRRRLPHEPAARARRASNAGDRACGRRAAARDRTRTLLGVRRLRLLPASALRPHRHPALGSRTLERTPCRRRRFSARLLPYVRDPYFFSDIGPLRIQQVGLRRRGRRVARRRTASSSAATSGRARLRAAS